MLRKIILITVGVITFALSFKFASFQMTHSQTDQTRYSMVTMNDKGVYEIGGVGTVAFTGSGLGPALEHASKEGWKVHSVVCPSVGGFVVIVEK